MKLILPNTFFGNSMIDCPLFFLAGPVNGGGNWQEQCCLEIAKLLPEFIAVVPIRWGPANKLFRYRATGLEQIFSRQADWEYSYLKRATELSKTHEGCVLFWMPLKYLNYRGEYARDTRGEIGRWGTRTALMKGHLVVGADQGFSGLDVIKRNLENDFSMNPDEEFPIYSTLAETVYHAVKWVKEYRQVR